MKINASIQIQQDGSSAAGTLEGFEKVEGGVVYSIFVPAA